MKRILRAWTSKSKEEEQEAKLAFYKYYGMLPEWPEPQKTIRGILEATYLRHGVPTFQTLYQDIKVINREDLSEQIKEIEAERVPTESELHQAVEQTTQEVLITEWQATVKAQAQILLTGKEENGRTKRGLVEAVKHTLNGAVGILSRFKPEQRTSTLQQDMKDFRRQYISVRDNPQRGYGLPWGIKAIDDATNGIFWGELAVIAAAPGKGKTTSLINMIYHQVITCGFNGFLWSGEMSKRQLWQMLACCVPGTLVRVEGGLQKKIEDLRIGDRVVTHTGYLQKITGIQARLVQEKLYSFKSWGVSGELGVTGNHPVLVLRREKAFVGKGSRKKRVTKNVEAYLEWIQAETVRVGDVLVQPREVVGKEVVGWSKEELWVGGLYLAEGCPVRKGGDLKGVEWNLCSEEKEVIKGLEQRLRKLGVKYWTGRRKNTNTWVVRAWCEKLARRMLSTFGEGSTQKRLSEEMYYISGEAWDEVMEGYWQGDGTDCGSSGVEWTTSSRDLGMQLYNSWTDRGLLVSLQEGENPAGPQDRALGIEKRFPCWKVVMGRGEWRRWQQIKGRTKLGVRWVAGPYVLTEIREVSVGDYKGLVHNLEVEEDHSYVAEGVVVHNCIHSMSVDWGEKAPKLDYDKVKKGTLSPEEDDFLLNTIIPDLERNPKYGRLYIEPSDAEYPTMEMLRTKAEVINQLDPLDAMYIDYDLLLNPSERNRYRTFLADANQVIKSMKMTAKSFAQGRMIAVVTCHQMNRKGEEEADKNEGVYRIQALSDANEIERSSDHIVATWSSEASSARKEARWTHLKNRDGRVVQPFYVFVDKERRYVGNLQTDDAAADAALMDV